MKKKIGRPPTKYGNYERARQLGRVSDEDWQLLKSAAEQSGLTFTEWALGHLLKQARKEIHGKRQKGKPRKPKGLEN